MELSPATRPPAQKSRIFSLSPPIKIKLPLRPCGRNEHFIGIAPGTVPFDRPCADGMANSGKSSQIRVSKTYALGSRLRCSTGLVGRASPTGVRQAKFSFRRPFKSWVKASRGLDAREVGASVDIIGRSGCDGGASMSLASTAPVGATDEFRPCSKVMYGKAPLVVLLCPSRLPRKTEKLAQGAACGHDACHIHLARQTRRPSRTQALRSIKRSAQCRRG